MKVIKWIVDQYKYIRSIIHEKYNKYIKFPIQRATRGYADIDVWSFEDYVIKVFPKMLRQLARTSHGYPCGFQLWVPDYETRWEFLKDNPNLELTEEQNKLINEYWNNTLIKLAEKFEYVENPPELEEHFKKYKIGDLVFKNSEDLTEDQQKYLNEACNDYNKIREHRYKILKEAMDEYTRLLPCLWD